MLQFNNVVNNWDNVLYTLSFTFQIIMLPVITTIILNYSKNMEGYKFCLLYNLFFIFLYNFIVFTIKPSQVTIATNNINNYCTIIVPSIFLPVSVEKFAYSIIICTIVNMQFSIILCLLYRVFMSFPENIRNKINKNVTVVILVTVLTSITINGIILYLMSTNIKNGQELSEIKMELSKSLPEVLQYANEVSYLLLY